MSDEEQPIWQACNDGVEEFGLYLSGDLYSDHMGCGIKLTDEQVTGLLAAVTAVVKKRGVEPAEVGGDNTEYEYSVEFSNFPGTILDGIFASARDAQRAINLPNPRVIRRVKAGPWEVFDMGASNG